MSRKGHKLGGKYGGSHTTVIPLAEKVCDLACSLPQVSKIIPSFIKSGLKTGKRRVKIIDLNGNILLSIRDNMAHQEVIVYIKRDMQDARLQIARKIRNAGINICFGNSSECK